jgi:hypothetical protein
VTALSALYAAQPLVVWVEDEETRRVLTTTWAGESVAIYVGGGNETIRAVVEDAWREGLRHVFGVVDRDFGHSNSDHWQNPGGDLKVYVLESSEIENLALDPDALAVCAYNTGRRSKEQIAERIIEAVTRMVWWMACCAVLDRVRRQRNADFPTYPRQGAAVVDLASALRYIQSSLWFSQHAGQLPSLATRHWLEAELDRQQHHFSTALSDGTWKTEFSGKQIFDRVVEFVHTMGIGRDKKLELLQGVAQAQIDLGTVPQELHRLKASLFSRR